MTRPGAEPSGACRERRRIGSLRQRPQLRQLRVGQAAAERLGPLLRQPAARTDLSRADRRVRGRVPAARSSMRRARETTRLAEQRTQLGVLSSFAQQPSRESPRCPSFGCRVSWRHSYRLAHRSGECSRAFREQAQLQQSLQAPVPDHRHHREPALLEARMEDLQPTIALHLGPEGASTQQSPLAALSTRRIAAARHFRP